MGVVESLSLALSTREDGLRLLISIIAGYPLAAIYRTFIYNRSVKVQHIYFVVVGVALYLFNYGILIYHSLLSILFAYLITNYCTGTVLSVVLAHVAFLGHLLVGYFFAESDHYDITWTTPFCIMTLRFTALVVDVYDGQKSKEKLKPDQVKTAIVNPPGLLEVAAYGLFFAGTFVGPQFSLNRFRSFVNGEFLDKKGDVRGSSLMPSLGRFVAGCFYAVIYQWGALWIPCEYFNTPEFFALPLGWKLIWSAIWFRFIMCRYLFSWLYTEGAAILAGLPYNGKFENGEDRWDGARDVHIILYETGLDFQSVIDSFNVGTNQFAKNYVYRRLQWLGNRHISHILTLVYLAVWHGYHLGYFVLFAFEFFCVHAQNEIYAIEKRIPGATEFFAHPLVVPFKYIVSRILITTSMGVGFLTFGLVKTRIWMKPLMSMYFILHILVILILPITFYIVKQLLPRKKDEIKKKQ